MTMSGRKPKPYIGGGAMENDDEYQEFKRQAFPLPRFIERRHGWGWRVYENGDDGIERWTYTGTFWRWIKAARVAQALNLAFKDGTVIVRSDAQNTEVA